jgi:hypothetical protein
VGKIFGGSSENCVLHSLGQLLSLTDANSSPESRRSRTGSGSGGGRRWQRQTRPGEEKTHEQRNLNPKEPERKVGRLVLR